MTTASGSGVNSNDILAAIQYPDPNTGQPSAAQQELFHVDALGDVVQLTDRNGNVHQYSYDVLGRLTSDAVTTLGAGVDGSVRRITYGYDSQGNLSLITSFDAASGGNVVNQVQRVFNGLGQLTGEYQSHSGAVVQGTTPVVQYAYTEMSGGQNNSRLVSMTYPSGYKLDYNYNSGLDNNISRLSSLVEDSTLTTLESYQYLGLDTVVERDHPQNHVNLTYIEQGNDPNANHDGGDQYTGLDRFGRVIDQNWVNTSTGQSTDRFQYGYNQDSDVLYRQNLVNATMSELYQYDNLHQLTNFQRGTLNSTHNGIVGTPSASQSWTPDALGNFTSVTTDGTVQNRTVNQQNEYTAIGSGTLSYDNNGNLTADGSGNTFVYDAWNRLVKVQNGSTTLAAYGYDGLNRRITETHGSAVTDLYYSASWQVLEEKVNGQLQARYMWSPTGVDTLVLRDDSSQGNGTLDRRLYVQQDANGNVTALVDVTGTVVERYDYNPFGTVTVLNPDFSVRGVSSYGWLYFFQGKRYDGAVGLYDSRERVYSPTLMRPLQTDPAGQAAGVNLYDWEGDDPTNEIDPSGEAGLPFWVEPPRRWGPEIAATGKGGYTRLAKADITRTNPSVEMGAYSLNLYSGTHVSFVGSGVEAFVNINAKQKVGFGGTLDLLGKGIVIAALGDVKFIQYKKYIVRYTEEGSNESKVYSGEFMAHGQKHPLNQQMLDVPEKANSPSYVQKDDGIGGGTITCPRTDGLGPGGKISWMFDNPTSQMRALESAYDDLVIKQKKRITSISIGGMFSTYLIREGEASYRIDWNASVTWKAGEKFNLGDLVQQIKMRVIAYSGVWFEPPGELPGVDMPLPWVWASTARTDFDLLQKAEYKDPIWKKRP